jgi:hypothetical protein
MNASSMKTPIWAMKNLKKWCTNTTSIEVECLPAPQRPNKARTAKENAELQFGLGKAWRTSSTTESERRTLKQDM